MIDLPAAPLLHRFRIKPPDPDEDVDGAHKVSGGAASAALVTRSASGTRFFRLIL